MSQKKNVLREIRKISLFIISFKNPSTEITNSSLDIQKGRITLNYPKNLIYKAFLIVNNYLRTPPGIHYSYPSVSEPPHLIKLFKLSISPNLEIKYFPIIIHPSGLPIIHFTEVTSQRPSTLFMICWLRPAIGRRGQHL